MSSRRPWGLSRGTVVAGALNLVAYVTASLAGHYSWGWAFWPLVIGGCLATVALIALAAVGAATERQTALLAGQEQRRMLQEMLVPIMQLFGEIAVTTSAPERRNRQEGLKHVVVQAARHIGSSHTRACLLELSGPPGARQLTCQPGKWYGRQEQPRTVFREGSPRGDRLLAYMDQRKPLYVPDLAAEPPQFQPATPSYRTFIAAPVTASTQYAAFGMLTIDSTDREELTAHDVKIIEILGQLLGSALAIGH